MKRPNSPTLKDIATKLNLSVTTISKVINNHADISEETRQQVLDTIKEIGYVPNFMAANLRRSNGRLVGLVLSDVSQPYFSEVIFGYESTLHQAGYQTLLFNSFEDPTRELSIIRQLATLNIAGVILDIAQGSERSIESLQDLGIPYVLSNRYQDEDEDYYVVADNELAGFLATKHLLERKPDRPVVCLNGPNNISPTTGRFEGYYKAMHESLCKINEAYIYNNLFGLRDAYETGLCAAKEVGIPFSAFCSTDQIAFGFLRGIYESSLRVPQDVGVIGVDGIESASYMMPALSTIELPKQQMGQQSAQMLISLIENKPVLNPRVKMTPVLKIRETT